MTIIAKIALMFVVFIDIIGQSLVFPIINSLIMERSSGFLPQATSDAARHFNYGLVIAIFFLAWFIGAPYISRLSDMIGRKPAILVCLFGSLAGYILTIISLDQESLGLLILGRAITGFTAGNQPIAQAAMIDGSVDEADRGRNMGYIITGASAGLVGGPIIGAVFSDPDVLGAYASLQLPFYLTLGLVAIAIALVVFGYHDVRQEREPLVIRPLEIVHVFARLAAHRLVLRIAIVFFFFQAANLLFYIFIDNFMASAFGYGTLGTSMVMLTIGAAIAVSSTFLVVPAQARFDKTTILNASFAVWIVAAAAVAAAPAALLCFVPIFAFYFVFGIAYPTMLSIFSLSVSDDEQGWVMGITIAVFTLVGGLVSLAGGSLMAIDIRLPFYVAIVFALVAMAGTVVTGRGEAMRRITRRT